MKLQQVFCADADVSRLTYKETLALGHSNGRRKSSVGMSIYAGRGIIALGQRNCDTFGRQKSYKPDAPISEDH